MPDPDVSEFFEEKCDMKAVVIAVKENKAAVMLKQGDFLYVENKSYEIGQIIDVQKGVSGSNKENTKVITYDKLSRRAKKYSTLKGFVAAACITLIIGGISFYALPDTSVELRGESSIVLDVNYFGRVVGTRSNNEEGRVVLSKVSHIMLGEPLENAVFETISAMHTSGYIDKTDTVIYADISGNAFSRNDKQAIMTELTETVNSWNAQTKGVSAVLKPAEFSGEKEAGSVTTHTADESDSITTEDTEADTHNEAGRTEKEDGADKIDTPATNNPGDDKDISEEEKYIPPDRKEGEIKDSFENQEKGDIEAEPESRDNNNSPDMQDNQSFRDNKTPEENWENQNNQVPPNTQEQPNGQPNDSDQSPSGEEPSAENKEPPREQTPMDNQPPTDNQNHGDIHEPLTGHGEQGQPGQPGQPGENGGQPPKGN